MTVKGQNMQTISYNKGIAMCGAVLLSSVALLTAITPTEVYAKQSPVVVTGNPNPDVVQRRVSYADLNLASAFGEKTLLKRVRGAVRIVCDKAVGPGAGAGSIFAGTYLSCREEAWQGAAPQIARAVLRAQQIAQTGHSNIAAAAITITLQ
jgi:UrcA family protein